jgi:hypothetical protein
MMATIDGPHFEEMRVLLAHWAQELAGSAHSSADSQMRNHFDLAVNRFNYWRERIRDYERITASAKRETFTIARPEPSTCY